MSSLFEGTIELKFTPMKRTNRHWKCIAGSLLMLAILALTGCMSAPEPYLLERTTSGGGDNDVTSSASCFDPSRSGWDWMLHSVSVPPRAAKGWVSHVLVIDSSGGLFHQLNFDAALGWASGQDVTGDDLPDILVASHTDSVCGISAFRWPDLEFVGRIEINSSQFPPAPGRKWDAQLALLGRVPSISDDSDLLLSVKSGSGLTPRGLMRANVISGEICWYQETAVYVESSVIVPVSADSTSLLIVGNYAPTNGAVCGQLNDATAYLRAMSWDGAERWLWSRAEAFAGYQFVECRSPEPSFRGAPFIQVLSSTNHIAGATQLMTVAAATGTVISQTDLAQPVTDNRIFPWLSRDHNANTCVFLIKDSTVAFANAQSRTTATALRANRILSTDDLNQDGSSELVVANDESVSILDHELRVLAVLPESLKGNHLLLQRRSREWGLLWSIDRSALHRYRMLANPAYPNWRVRRALTIMIAGVLVVAGLLAAWRGILWIVALRRAEQRAKKELTQIKAIESVVRDIGHNMKNTLARARNLVWNMRAEVGQSAAVLSPQVEAYFNDLDLYNEALADAALRIEKYAGLTPLTRQATRIGPLINEVVTTRSVPPNITVVCNIDDNLPAIMVDRKQFRWVMHNLVSNAFKAMKEGGQLRLKAYVTSAFPGDSPNARWLLIECEDTGCGIPQDQIPRIFDIGFSTFAEGSGIGLSFVKKTVIDHGGAISVSSKVSAGTTFVIRLPMETEL